MRARGCDSPLGWELLVRYFAGELGAEDEAALEEHAFACRGCAENLAAVATVVIRVREGVRTGAIMSVISPATLERLRSSGVRVKEEIPSADHCETTYDRDTDLLIARVRGDFSGVKRVDVEFHTAYAGLGYERDVPVTGPELLVACTRHHFRDPKGPLETRLLVVDADGPDRRILAELHLRMRGPVEAPRS